MASIAKTRLGTSDILDLCKGFALFPALGTSRAGVAVAGSTGSILDTQDALFFWRLSASAGFALNMGVCGPAYAIGMDLEGSVDEMGIDLTVSNDAVAAGLTTGLKFDLSFAVNLDRYEWYPVWDGWNTHLDGRWSSWTSVSLSIGMDVIDFIKWVYDLIVAESGEKKAIVEKVGPVFPSLLQSWGMYDKQENGLVAGEGKVTARPTLNIPVDVSSMVPALRAFNKSVEPFVSIATGPQFGIQIPVEVQLDAITINDAVEYSGFTFPNGRLHGTTTGQAPSTVEKIGVKLSHTPGFDFTLGWFFALSAFKLFNLNASLSVPVLAMFGIDVTAGTYANALAAPVGATSVAALASCSPGGETALLEVVFE